MSTTINKNKEQVKVTLYFTECLYNLLVTLYVTECLYNLASCYSTFFVKYFVY